MPSSPPKSRRRLTEAHKANIRAAKLVRNPMRGTHHSATNRLKMTLAQRNSHRHYPRRWYVDVHGDEHYIRVEGFTLPSGAVWGRNARRWSRW